MIEGVSILIGGFIVGFLVARYLFTTTSPRGSNKYDKYRNPDGLYSSKAVKGDK